MSMFLIAVGAILTWAVTDRSRAVDLNVVGVILMLVGLFGLLLSLLLWERWGGGYFRRRTYVDAGAAPAYGYRRRGYGRRATVVEEEGAPPTGPPAGPGPYDAPPPP